MVKVSCWSDCTWKLTSSGQSATLRLTAFEKFCHCVQTKCSERGASMAFASGDRGKRRLSVLVTSAMPSCAAKLAEANRFSLSVRSRLKPM